jgi:hypothetical protein
VKSKLQLTEDINTERYCRQCWFSLGEKLMAKICWKIYHRRQHSVGSIFRAKMKATCSMLRSTLKWKLPGRLEALVMQHLSEEISGSAKSLKRNSDHETGGTGSDL